MPHVIQEVEAAITSELVKHTEGIAIEFALRAGIC
jgi:hypothetical protein